jgi:hypothetical protein
MRLLGEEENGASGHAFGYKTAGQADKPFLNDAKCTRFSRAERCLPPRSQAALGNEEGKANEAEDSKFAETADPRFGV